MRLHTLRIESFGPFAGVETIDFDSVGADGLFLLHGQTGAGKTTILDAIAFALYGSVPGVRTESKRYLSDHAAPGAVPTITLEASVKGRRFRIVRSPEFDRPKKRGDGSVKEKAKAVLTWLDGAESDGRENLTRIDEIADAVCDLLGMSKDQFFQVVLLPQGEFARFLRASNDDREKLLESLFDTQRFGSVESWFAERRKEAERRLSRARQRFDVVIGKITHAAGAEAGPDGDPRTWLGQLRAHLAKRYETAQAQLESASHEFDSAREAVDNARTIAERQQKYRDAQKTLAELARSESERSDRAEALERARRAQPFAVAEQELFRIRKEADEAASAMKLAAESLSLIRGGSLLIEQLSWPPGDEDGAVLRTAIQAWTEESGALKELCERADDASRLERAIRDIDREITAVATARVQAEAEVRELPAARAEIEAQLAAAATAQARLDALQTRCTELRRAHAAATELASAGATLESARRALQLAHAGHLDSRERLVEVREQRIAGMASELAAGLAEGEECAVCGSRVHPRPAVSSPTAVSRKDEEVAAAAERRAAEELERTRITVAELEKRSVVLADQARGCSVEEISTELSAAEDDLRDATQRAVSMERLVAERQDLAAREQTLLDQIAALDAKSATLTERRQGLEQRISDVRASLDAARGDDESVRTRKDRIDALASAAHQLHDARGSAGSAAQRLIEHEAYLQTLAEEAGFTSLSDARSAVKPRHWIAETEALLESARDSKVRAQGVLDDPAIQESAQQPPADVPAAETSLTEARSAMESAVRQHTEAKRAHESVASLAAEFDDILAELDPAEHRYAQLSLLSEVIAGRGENTRRMSLRSYVLAARLEEVAVAASARLRVMTGGRYEFVHSDAAGPRGLRGGLGLDIRDDYTGVVRSAKTLSGGETFMASLSLALGLADVVTAESGGIMLDTLFIDEGFGTLDSDTLDAVMGVLDELRAGGRVVGIVSHVDEMRQRIPSRLHVIKGRDGSHVRSTALGCSA